jgi:predicted ribosomally synthesized peptide with SipW-like signal peptide
VRNKIIMNVLVLILSVAMIAAATMAWFTHNDEAGNAIFTAGTVSIKAGRKVVADEGEPGSSDTVDGTFYPVRVVEYSPGPRIDGKPVKEPRNNPENALGAPESGQDENNFCSLGFGGTIILEFDHGLYAPTLAVVVEDTWGGKYPLEEAHVWVSDTGLDDDWDYVGKADNKNLVQNQTYSGFTFEFVDIRYIKYVKITDCSNKDDFDGYDPKTVDGFDLNAVYINGHTQEEDNWNPGDENERVYTITNTGTKAIRLRGKLTGKWYEYDEETKSWKMCYLSPDVVSFKLRDDETEWVKSGDDDCFYYIPSIPGTYGDDVTEEDRTVELIIKVCLDGPDTGNEYQGKRFIVEATFEAIQASNGAPEESGWYVP